MLMLQVRYTLQAGVDCDAFLLALEKENIPTRTLAESGCFQYEFFYSTSSPKEVLLLECWADDIAMQAHKKTEQCAALQRVKTQFVEDVSFKLFRVE